MEFPEIMVIAIVLLSALLFIIGFESETGFEKAQVFCHEKGAYAEQKNPEVFTCFYLENGTQEYHTYDEVWLKYPGRYFWEEGRAKQ